MLWGQFVCVFQGPVWVYPYPYPYLYIVCICEIAYRNSFFVLSGTDESQSMIQTTDGKWGKQEEKVETESQSNAINVITIETSLDERVGYWTQPNNNNMFVNWHALEFINNSHSDSSAVRSFGNYTHELVLDSDSFESFFFEDPIQCPTNVFISLPNFPLSGRISSNCPQFWHLQ